MRRDLPRQVCARFGQSVRAVRDPPDDRLTVLGPLTTGRGSRVPVLVGASASLQLSLVTPGRPGGYVQPVGCGH